MNLILVKMFATALSLAQVTTQPDAVKTHFDPITDQAEVVQLLKNGCAHMRKAFDIEDLNLDDLIETALQDPQTVAGEIKAFRGINFDDLHIAYRQFCGKGDVENSPFNMAEVIEFYNNAVAELPDHNKLKGLKLPGTSVVLDGKGEKFAELFESDHRRTWVPLSAIPDHVQKAFIAAEDKRFYQHKGVDERGLIRAFIANIAQPGRPQGGSTITQQVAKNLLVGDDVSYERKIREMIVAARIDQSLSKDEVLEVYLNSIFLGRGSWGIDMAAHTYFRKPASALSVTEGAVLASLAKGPAYFSPDRYPERSRERYAYVIKRMQEEKIPGTEDEVASAQPRIWPYEKPRRETGFHFVDHLMREAKTLVGMQSLTVDSYTVRSTINTKLQRASEYALQEGLAKYESSTGRAKFEGPETNLGETVARYDTDQRTRAQRRGKVKPTWQMALQNARLPLYDVQWPPAIVVEKKINEKGGASIRVGLKDGSILPLWMPDSINPQSLKLNDVIYVKLEDGKPARGADGKMKTGERIAHIRVRPKVQGATIVLENKTGRILAMVGGFSYVQSQLNRTTQSIRQPGSSIKPLTYLAALHKGLQPNTLVYDSSVTLPPIAGVTTHYWSPKNYEGGGAGVITFRRALEQSKNLVTARLLDGAIDKDPRRSLEMVCELAMEAGVYRECMKNYPFVLGAQALRMIDLAGLYAAIANEGMKVTPYSIDAIEQAGRVVYRHKTPPPTYMADGDRAAFYQLRTILEGVVSRGTAISMKQHTGFIAGKTGTTDSENDAWFAGFNADVTVIVWVGYDNARDKKTLGDGATGGRTAVPISEPIFQAAWQYQAEKKPLPPPSLEASKVLKAFPIDVYTGQRVSPSKTAFMEYFRTVGGKVRETQHALVGAGRVASRPAWAPPAEERSAPAPAMRQAVAAPSRAPRTLRELFGLQRY
ncbi:MAG: transglycosylase domain-containing protein [Pseudomonadota bacterium]